MDHKLSGKKILFANVPADGHFNPLSGLAIHLKDLGCDVRWLSSGVYAEKIKRMGIPHFPLVHTLDVNASNIAQLVPEILTNDPVKRLTLYRIQYAKRSSEYFEDIREIYESFPFDLIVVDSLFPAIPYLRHKMDVPVVAIGVVPLAEDSVDTAPYGLALLPPVDDATREAYADLYLKHPDRCKEASDLFESLLAQYDVPYVRTSIENRLIKEADVVLQIGIPEFEYERSDMGSNIHFIGALLPYSTPKNDQPWYDERLKRYEKIVLVTQGTVEKDFKKIVEPTLQAFKGTDVLVIATTGGNGTAELREKYQADNVIIEDFIAFKDVMPHAGVYVTNGGYGGTLLSITHKLPMLTAGLHEGKNEICARVGYFKLGIDLKTEFPTPEMIYTGVYEILENKSYRNEVTAIADKIKAYDAHAICTEHMVALLGS